MSADEGSHVEFIGADGAGSALPPDSPARQRGYLILAAVILAAVALIGRAATSHKQPQTSADRPSHAPTQTAAPITSIAPSAVEIGVDSCPKASYCLSSSEVPAAVVTALHRYLPAFGAPAVTTITRKDAASDPADLWSRVIEAHNAAIDVVIVIRGPDAPRPSPSIGLTPTPPGLASAIVRTSASGYEVDVQWTAPDTQPPPITQITALTKDERLEALS